MNAMGKSSHHPGEPLDPALIEAFRDAMGHLASAVTIITAGTGAQARGLTATAVCSVALAPPTLLVCVNRNGEAHRAIVEAGSFCVNILAEHNRHIADRFAGRHGHLGAEKFTEGDWTTLATGAPVLADALMAVDCVLAEQVEAHSHTVFFGEVRAVHAGAPAAPLLHFDRAYRLLA